MDSTHASHCGWFKCMQSEFKEQYGSVFALSDWAFFSASTVVFAGSLAVNILNYVFTLVISRLVGVEHFGEVVALLGLSLIVSVPASALAMLMAREVAAEALNGTLGQKRLYDSLQDRTFFAAGTCWLLFLVAVPLFSNYLHIARAPLLIFSLLVPLALLSALQSGTLQGMHNFWQLAQQNIVGSVVKLIASVLLVLIGFSVAGIMGALVLAALSAYVFGMYSVRSLFPSTASASHGGSSIITARFSFNAIASLVATALLLALLSNIDVVLAKHYLAPEIAGQYAALSTAGKIIIYGVGALATVLLPMASNANARGNGKDRRVLYLTLGATAGACLAAIALFAMAPQFVVTVLLGSRYAMITDYLGTFAIAMSAFALSTAFINFFIATRNTSYIYLLAMGVGVEIIAVTLFHSSLGEIVAALMYSSLAVLVLMVANYLLNYRLRIV